MEEGLFDQATHVIDHLMTKYIDHVPQLYYSRKFLAARQKDYATEFFYFKKVLETSGNPIDEANFLGVT